LILTSLNTLTDSISYEGAHFTNFGYEYHPGSDGDVTWSIERDPTWKILASAMGPDPSVDVGQRDISNEPMAIILVSLILNCIFRIKADQDTVSQNLAISTKFQEPQWGKLVTPGTFRIE